MKKKILGVMAAALILGMGAGTSYAYLTGRDQADNYFAASETKIEIQETFTPVSKLTPGMVITKAPRAVSSSDVSCYVRMTVRFSDSEAESFCEPLVIRQGWSDRGDGYYYWEKELQPGETTDALFDSVAVKKDAGAEELKPFEILVYAEAVQSRGMGMEEAWRTLS